MADVGTGTTIAFGTSGFTAEVMSVAGNDITREDIEVTNMASTNYREFIPSKLVDAGSIEMEISFDPNSQPPIAGAAEVITITFPLPAGGATPATLVFSGYVNSWSWTSTMEEKMEGTITIKIDGNSSEPAWTAST
jgi:hypothetical protein